MIRIEDNTKCLFYQKNEANIKVAQYLIALSDKQWVIDKLNKSIAIAQENVEREEAGAFKVVQQEISKR
jgi:hypothetical protein